MQTTSKHKIKWLVFLLILGMSKDARCGGSSVSERAALLRFIDSCNTENRKDTKWYDKQKKKSAHSAAALLVKTQ